MSKRVCENGKNMCVRVRTRTRERRGEGGGGGGGGGGGVIACMFEEKKCLKRGTRKKKVCNSMQEEKKDVAEMSCGNVFAGRKDREESVCAYVRIPEKVCLHESTLEIKMFAWKNGRDKMFALDYY